MRWQIQKALRNSTRLIAVSNEISKLMVKCGADSSRITVIPNGVDLERFQVVHRVQARQLLGLPLDRPIVLTVGYRIPLKGFNIFIDAIGELKQSDPSILGLIVGGPAQWMPDCAPQLKLQIRRAALENHVKLAGYRPHGELALWYAASDVFVLLSSREGSPNVVMEALACGTPVVATRVGGIPDLLDGKEFAVLLSERTSHAAATGIRKFLQAPPDRSEIRRFAESHSWEVTAARVYQVWKQALLDYHQDQLPA
jgi:glycosyltransferase involved in cell wall biosynthesis